MSWSNVNRSFQRRPTELLNDARAKEKLSASKLTQQIAEALKAEFGIGNFAIRTIAHLTSTNERAVKNWMNGQNGPSAESFVMLCRHSESVLELFMILAGRENLLANKSVRDCRFQLQQAMRTIDKLEAIEIGKELAC